MRGFRTIQIRYIFHIKSGSTPESGNPDYWDGEIFWVTPEDVTKIKSDGYLKRTKRKITEEGFANSGTTLVPPGSIVLTKRAPIGQLAILKIEACSNQGCFLLKPFDNVSSRFFYYFFSTQKEVLHALGRGSTFMELSTDDLKSFKVPIPSYSIQQRIATYLDRATAHIDQLIATKEKQFTLLEEKRKALITRAVTRGLDPKTKMKDSGVEWLGEVPEHWDVTKLKYIGDTIIGIIYSPSNIVDGNSGVLVLRASNIQDGKLSLDDNVFVDIKIMEKQITQIGDILICSRSGSADLIGKNILIDEESEGLTFGAFMSVFRSKYYRFLYWFFNSEVFSSQKGLFSTTTINQLTTGILNNFSVAIPSDKEQLIISNYLNNETTKIDNLIKMVRKSLVLLKERREAMLSDVVTGQIEITES